MTLIDSDTNKIYAFTDAIDALKELLEQARAQRDSFSKDGFISYVDPYLDAAQRVETLEDALEALSTEERVGDLIHQFNAREG
jgi:uncharacterized protein YukE